MLALALASSGFLLIALVSLWKLIRRLTGASPLEETELVSGSRRIDLAKLKVKPIFFDANKIKNFGEGELATERFLDHMRNEIE